MVIWTQNSHTSFNIEGIKRVTPAQPLAIHWPYNQQVMEESVGTPNLHTAASIYAALSMKNKPEPMGELALIEQIRRDSSTRASKAVVLGIGDDCAILKPPSGSEILV